VKFFLMATKARGKAAETKKKAAKKSADSPPFFRPFADLKRKAKKASKADAKVEAEKAGKKDVAAKKGAAHARGAGAEHKAASEEPARSPSEAETFAMYMAGVRTLEERSTRIPKSSSRLEAKTPRVETKDLDEDARAALHSLVAEGFRFEVVDDGERIEGRRVDVDPREVRRLRRGAYTIDGRIDLHGKTAAEARKEVEKFIRKKRADGDRVVSVIVGRGSHSPRGIGVLRGEIAAWLSHGPSAHHVAAFASAPEDEGGSGVVLVLLAR